MTAGTILFIDIVGFSRKPTNEQRRLVEELTVEIIHELRPLLQPPLADPNVIALPTGDGVALAFLHSPNCQWNIETIYRLILKLQKWAYGRSICLRIGVHVGPVQIITDINGKPNVCGDTINYTQRVMDAANPKQVLISDEAYREYVGIDSLGKEKHLSEELKVIFDGPYEISAKHRLQIIVYKMEISPPQDWWSNDAPVAKNVMFVELTPLPKEIVGSYSKRIEKASHIALIQLTGDRLLASLKNNSIKLSKKLKRLWVFMPDAEIDKSFRGSGPHHFGNQGCIDQWKQLLKELKTQYPSADIKLGLFKEPPYLGASFVDWERAGGVIHISPYIWNVKAKDCPGYDITWIGKNPSLIYERYADGLEYINATTKNILD